MDGGILSQDEINALLSGMASGEPIPETLAAPEPAPKADPSPSYAPTFGDVTLSDMEKDAIGEVANISMGTSATTLFSLVNKKVYITTPVVDLCTWKELQEESKKPCVFIQIKYTCGLDGSNILILSEQDVKVITDLMMGGDGTNVEGELSELHLSAISEAMNQMMGSSATSLSTMLGKMIDISPPIANLVDMQDGNTDGTNVADFLAGTFVKISFRMQIDELVDSTILQLYPVEFAKEIVQTFLGGDLIMPEEEPAKEPEPTVEAYVPPVVTPTPQPEAVQPASTPVAPPPVNMAAQMQPQQPVYTGMPMYGMPQQPQAPMNYQQAQFQSFQGNVAAVPGNENIGLIMDVPLEVTVELGRTRKSISEILDFAPGTIIELDKIAGEPIDVLVNGKFVAKGEVVVIEESFGIRVTEITK